MKTPKTSEWLHWSGGPVPESDRRAFFAAVLGLAVVALAGFLACT